MYRLPEEKRASSWEDCETLILGIQRRENVTAGIMDFHKKYYRELLRKVLYVFFDMEESGREKYLERLNTM